MKTKILIFTLFFCSLSVFSISQVETSSGFHFGGYGQFDYNKTLNDTMLLNGKAEVHRLVGLIGYQFNSNITFNSEIEVEYGSELYVEQAFIDWKLLKWATLRTGMILIPMGRVNETHEPPTFNSVERPLNDNIIVPSTWREMGVGLTGKFFSVGFDYQLYLVNGPLSYSITKGGLINGEKFIRDSRQKGIKAIVLKPGFSGKINYTGIQGFKAGIAFFYSQTQSELFAKLNKNNPDDIKRADSSILGITMSGVDISYQIKGLELKGQFTFGSASNTEQYNKFTKKDVGSTVLGYYGEIGYNVFRNFKINKQLIPFFRYEFYNTHFSTQGNLAINKKFNAEAINAGLHFKIHEKVSLKTDVQFLRNKADHKFVTTFNAGIGFSI